MTKAKNKIINLIQAGISTAPNEFTRSFYFITIQNERLFL